VSVVEAGIQTVPGPETYRIRPKDQRLVKAWLVALATASWVLSAWGWATNAQQFHASYLVSYLFFTTIAWGAAFFVAVQHITTAAWSVTVRRLMETIMMTLPVAAGLFLPVVRGIDVLYQWSRPGFFDPHNPDLAFKRLYFSPGYYEARAAVYFSVWILLAVMLYRWSLRQDREGGSLEAVARLRWWSGPGIAALFVTVTSAGVDWVMSLDPYWYSTIFGIYVYAGGALAFIAAVTALALALRQAGYLREWIHVEHYHDLGKWMFALTVFWAYIAFSQYMLIWYANIPEETIWYKERFQGSWRWVSLVLAIGHFVVPFFVLMSRAAKRRLPVLATMSVWILVMHWVDLHWLVMPTVHHHGFHLHWLDLVTWLAVGSTFGLVAWVLLGRNALIPVGDLRLAESLSHRNE